MGSWGLITAVETTGDVRATGEIAGKRIKRADIPAALRADGVDPKDGRDRRGHPVPGTGQHGAGHVAAVAVVGVQTLGKVPPTGCPHHLQASPGPDRTPKDFRGAAVAQHE